jgi:quercetin dioxygenase-like cupin family protein
MSKLQALKTGSLAEAPSSPGISRHLAFKGDGFMLLRSQSDPNVISGWHHHGDYDVYGYVVSGRVRLESETEEKEAISIGPGDFFHLSPQTVHRELNPSSNEGNDILLFLRGTGPLVYNMDGPGED